MFAVGLHIVMADITGSKTLLFRRQTLKTYKKEKGKKDREIGLKNTEMQTNQCLECIPIEMNHTSWLCTVTVVVRPADPALIVCTRNINGHVKMVHIHTCCQRY